MKNLRDNLRWRSAISFALILLCVLGAVIIGFVVSCDPRILVPPAPITRAPSVTPTKVSPTLTPTQTATVTHTHTATQTLTPTLQPTDTATNTPTLTPTPTNIPTIQAGRNLTPFPLPDTGASTEQIARMTRTHR